MVWVIVALLVIIAALMASVVWEVHVAGERVRLTIAAASEIQTAEHQRILAELEDIAAHTERVAKPFYEADADRRLHPERYSDY